MLQSLLTLEQGEVTISDGTVTLSGAPSTSAVADQVTAVVTKVGGTATLEPPRVTDFILTIAKHDGKTLFSGFVPDTQTKEKLSKLNGADTSKLALGRGAPDRFASALDFGLQALDHLNDGQFSIKGTKLSIGGRAATVADFKATNDLIGQGAPQGLTLAAAEIHPPVANPFTWSAKKAVGGLVSVTGYVPDEATRKVLDANAGNVASDSADPADGAPKDFATAAGKGLEVLTLLDSGSLSFDGTNWAIEGNVDTPQKGFAADAAYSVAGLRTAGWSYSVHLPEAKAAAPLPIIAPYVWRAQKTADGERQLLGLRPCRGLQELPQGSRRQCQRRDQSRCRCAGRFRRQRWSRSRRADGARRRRTQPRRREVDVDRHDRERCEPRRHSGRAQRQDQRCQLAGRDPGQGLGARRDALSVDRE